MIASENLAALVEPLLAACDRRSLRLVARPGFVSVDRADGAARLDLPWSETEQEEVLATLEPLVPVRLTSGATVVALDGTLVVHLPTDPLRQSDALVGEGWLSPLAARLLDQTLAIGRNLLLVGPWSACAELGAALLADGNRPAMIGPAQTASPPSWPLFASTGEARAYGADRIGCWTTESAVLAGVMTELSGVVGWIDGGRLDRALIRFEAAGQGSANPLRVLAALDLTALVAQQPSPRVRDLTEIQLVEEGYRPITLFTTGLPPAPTALMPVAAPSFVGEIAEAGQPVLADELSHAVAGAPVAAAPVEPASTQLAEAPVILAEPTVEPPRPEAPPPSTSFVRAPPKPDPTLEDAPPPGWELDQLGDEESAVGGGSEGDADAAVMAATFGLAPPPKPEGVTGAGAAPFAGTFADALAEAKQRDAQLREELRRAEEEEEEEEE